jgi:hypothetical protein
MKAPQMRGFVSVGGKNGAFAAPDVSGMSAETLLVCPKQVIGPFGFEVS